MLETCILQQTSQRKYRAVRHVDADKPAMMPKSLLASWAAGLKGGNTGGGGGRKEGQGEMVGPQTKGRHAAA